MLRKLVLKLIRKATYSDISKINELGKNLHDNFEKTYHIETEINNNLAIVLVDEENKRISAYLYALCFDDNIDILSIYVDTNYRLKHIGYNLVKKLQEIGKTITLEVSDKNSAALSLYRKCGFKIVGTRKKYYKESDAIVMKWGI